MFTANEVFPGIFQITDAMGVCFTLIEGREKAILFDAGYGTEDVASYVRSLTDKPLELWLSHGHHDHVLGARWFDRALLCEEDLEEYRVRTGQEQRIKVCKQAESRGVSLPKDFMAAAVPVPSAPAFPESTGPFSSVTEDLGHREIRIIRVPGHTPGSITIFIPGDGLLLTGDDWNPCTWMWFPTSLPADLWQRNMLDLIHSLELETEYGIRHVLCSHYPLLLNGRELKEFIDYMTPERMKNAPSVDMGAPIHTHEIRNEEQGWVLVFDSRKISH